MTTFLVRSARSQSRFHAVKVRYFYAKKPPPSGIIPKENGFISVRDLSTYVLRKNGHKKDDAFRENAVISTLKIPVVGIEPTLPRGNGILSPARLPIPPHWQMIIVTFADIYLRLFTHWTMIR